MEDKIDSLFDLVEKEIEKDSKAKLFGASDIRMLSHVPHGIPSHQPSLDLCIGKDGIPIGRVIEFYGKPRCGKSTAALHIISEFQKKGGVALFIDTEQTYDPDRAIECGVKVDKTLRIVSAESVEAVFRTIEAFLLGLSKLKFERDAIIIVDSITGVDCEFNLAREFGETVRLGEEARTIRLGMKRIVPLLAKMKASLIFVNHAISTMNPYGKQSQAAGGYAIKFFASLRIEFKHLGEIKDKEAELRLGQRIQVEVEKLKGGPLTRTKYESKLLNDIGFDVVDQLLDASVEIGIIKRKGNIKYCLMDLNTNEELESFSRADWPGWVKSKGGFEEIYKWWMKNAIALNIISPWGESRYEVKE